MRRIRPWKSPVCRLMLSLGCGLLRMAAGVLLCAAVLLAMPMPEWLLAWLATILWCLAGGSAAACFARHTGRHGLGCGLLCGSVLCLLLLTGMRCLHSPWHAGVWVRGAAILLTSLCGGVYGVNRKRTKPPN